eukprot:1419482-Rhodomonas_salina.1
MLARQHANIQHAHIQHAHIQHANMYPGTAGTVTRVRESVMSLMSVMTTYRVGPGIPMRTGTTRNGETVGSAVHCLTPRLVQKEYPGTATTTGSGLRGVVPLPRASDEREEICCSLTAEGAESQELLQLARTGPTETPPGSTLHLAWAEQTLGLATPKSNTRNRIRSPNCTRNACSPCTLLVLDQASTGEGPVLEYRAPYDVFLVVPYAVISTAHGVARCASTSTTHCEARTQAASTIRYASTGQSRDKAPDARNQML